MDWIVTEVIQKGRKKNRHVKEEDGIVRAMKVLGRSVSEIFISECV